MVKRDGRAKEWQEKEVICERERRSMKPKQKREKCGSKKRRDRCETGMREWIGVIPVCVNVLREQ